MKSSTALSVLMLLASTEAFPQRSTADGLMKRNLADVLASDNVLVKRGPQGPSSNPGEAINPGASNANNANSAPHGGNANNPNTNADVIGSDSTGADGKSNGGAGGAFDSFVPEMGGNGMSASGSASITTSASMTSGSPRPSSMVQMVSSQRPDRPVYPGPEGGMYPPGPTGGSGAHAPRPTGHKEPSVGETLVETQIKEDGDSIITHEVLWQYNGTGWSMIGVPLPSGVISGIHLPPSTSSGAGGMTQGTGTPEDSGLQDVLLTPIDNGFTGPESPQSVWDILYSWIMGTGRGRKPSTDQTAMDGQSADMMPASGEDSDMMGGASTGDQASEGSSDTTSMNEDGAATGGQASGGASRTSPMDAQSSGTSPMDAQSSGTSPMDAQSSGTSPMDAQSSGISPMDAQSSGTTPMDPNISGLAGQANAGGAGTAPAAGSAGSAPAADGSSPAPAEGPAAGGAGAVTAKQKKRGW